MEVFALLDEAIFDFLAIVVEALTTVFDLIGDALNKLVRVLNLLADLVTDLVLRIVVHQLHPLNKILVLGNDLIFPLSFDFVKVALHFDEFVRLFGRDKERVKDLPSHGHDLAKFIDIVLENLLDNAVDEALTLVDESVVEFVALDKEHAHSDLVWGLLLDLLDGVKVDLDAGVVLLTVTRSGCHELLDLLALLKDEEVLVVDVDGFAGDQKVVYEDLLDFLTGVKHNLVILADVPEVQLVRVGDLSVRSGDVVDGLDHLGDDLDELIADLIKRLLEADLSAVHLEFESQECPFELVVGSVLTADDLLRQRVVTIIFAEAAEELNILIDRVGCELACLVTHQGCHRVKECLGLVPVQVLELIPEDVDGAVLPLTVEDVAHLVNLLALPLNEVVKVDRVVLGFQQVHEQSVVVLFLAPHAEELERGLRADAKGLTHEHASHHDVVLPVLVRLDPLVVIVTPSDGLVDDLLDSKSLHLVLILQDVVQDGLADTVEVILVDLVEHGVDKLFNSLLVDSVKVARDQLNDMGEPVLTDGGDHVDLDLILDVLAVAVERNLASLDVRVTEGLVVDHCLVLLLLTSGVDVVFVDNVKLRALIVDVLVAHGPLVNIDVETFAGGREISSNAVTH